MDSACHNWQVAHATLQARSQSGGDVVDAGGIAAAWVAESISKVDSGSALIDRRQSENNRVFHACVRLAISKSIDGVEDWKR